MPALSVSDLVFFAVEYTHTRTAMYGLMYPRMSRSRVLRSGRTCLATKSACQRDCLLKYVKCWFLLTKQPIVLFSGVAGVKPTFSLNAVTNDLSRLYPLPSSFRPLAVEIKVLALVSEESALPTVLQCLALHTTSRGITDSAVAVAGALLAAAHEGGWASTIDLPKGRPVR